MVSCSQCPREVMDSEARVSQRACGAVLCWRCRRQKYPTFASVHQAPAGCRAEIRPSGYGRFECSLVAPCGRTFVAGGMTDELALSRARAAAVQAGAL